MFKTDDQYESNIDFSFSSLKLISFSINSLFRKNLMKAVFATEVSIHQSE